MPLATPLSLRERLALPFFYMRFGPTGSGSHTNLVYSARLTGPLDVAKLQGAFETLTRETPTLRGYFSGPEEPPARWTSETPPPFRLVDASGDAKAFKAAVREAAQRPFPLASFPLLALTIVRRSPERHVLVLAAHHLLMDGWSIVMLMRALSRRYRGLTTSRRRDGGDPGAEADAREAFLASAEAQDMREAAAAWLAPARELLKPTIVVGFPNAAESHGFIRLPTKAAHTAARNLGLTPTALHRLLFVLWQHDLTGARELAFSEAHAHRPADALERYGFISDDLLLRIGVNPAEPVRGLTARLQAALEQARSFAAIPASQILRELDPAAAPLPRFHFNPLSVGAGALRLGPVRVSPFKLMPAFGVAEAVFVSGDLDRTFLALAGGRVGSVDLAGARSRLRALVERLSDPDRAVGALLPDREASRPLT